MDDRSVGACVRRTFQCIVENGGSDPDAVWHRRSNGSRNEACSGVWRSVHGKGYFWGAPLQPMRTSRRFIYTCATVPQPFRSCGLGWCVRWAEALLCYMAVHVVQGEGEVLRFLLSIFTMWNAVGSPTVKRFRFVCENLTTVPFGKHIVGKLDSWAFWWCIRFQYQRRVLWEISKKVTIALRQNKRKVAGVTCIFMNERHGALAHPHGPDCASAFGYPCWPQIAPWETFAATRPSSQITLGRLVIVYYAEAAVQCSWIHTIKYTITCCAIATALC